MKDLAPKVEELGDRALASAGVDKETAAKSAAALKLLHDLNVGEINYDINDNLKLKAKDTPEEKMIKLKYNKRF